MNIIRSATIAIKTDNRYLLIDIGKGWELPGGKMELGEWPKEAAFREFYEETNVEFPNEAIKSCEYTYTFPNHTIKRTVENTQFIYVISYQFDIPITHIWATLDTIKELEQQNKLRFKISNIIFANEKTKYLRSKFLNGNK